MSWVADAANQYWMEYERERKAIERQNRLSEGKPNIEDCNCHREIDDTILSPLFFRSRRWPSGNCPYHGRE